MSVRVNTHGETHSFPNADKYRIEPAEWAPHLTVLNVYEGEKVVATFDLSRFVSANI